MRIQSTRCWVGQVRADSPKPASASAPAGFGDILKNTLDQASAAASMAGLGATLGVRLAPNQPLPGDDMTAQLEDLLKFMDEYRRGLADPGVRLKELNPLVDHLERRCQELTPVMESLSEDPELKDIFSRALAVSETEIMKFRRGDYLPV